MKQIMRLLSILGFIQVMGLLPLDAPIDACLFRYPDGGGTNVPTFRILNPDGSWFKEWHGVDPDIEVKVDLGQMAK
jgi:C-terminal processing protease CtpA/Prc